MDEVHKVTIEYDGKQYDIATYSDKDHIHKALESTRTFYEIDTLSWVRSRQREGVYIDVGANIGNHAIWFAEKCPSVSVVAVEGNNLVLPLLKINSNCTEKCAAKIQVLSTYVSDAPW